MRLAPRLLSVILFVALTAWALRVMGELRISLPSGEAIVALDSAHHEATLFARNVGTGRTTVSQVWLFGDGAGAFTVEGLAAGEVLQPLDQRTITVRFSPDAGGDFVARLVVDSDDHGGRNASVSLCGRATDAGVDGGLPFLCEAPFPPDPPVASPPVGCGR